MGKAKRVLVEGDTGWVQQRVLDELDALKDRFGRPVTLPDSERMLLAKGLARMMRSIYMRGFDTGLNAHRKKRSVEVKYDKCDEAC
jgi:hypothetical protein